MTTDQLTDPDDAIVTALLSAATANRPGEIRAALDLATDVLGLGRCVDQVLLPAIRQLGRQHHGHPGATIGLAVETTRAWLESRAAAAPAPNLDAPVLLACGPRDRHSLGLEALAVLLRYRGQPTRMLGGRASARAVFIAIEANRPAGIVLVTQLGTGYRQATDILRAVDDIGIATFYAGAAFASVALRQDVPGVYLGATLADAATTIVRAVDEERSAGTSQSE